jgi:hypothetical protein
MEVSNTPLMVVLVGVIAGVLALTTRVAPLGSSWLTFSVLAPVALLQMLAIVYFGARWVVTAETDPAGGVLPDPPMARRWWLLTCLSVLTGLALVVVSAELIYEQYQATGAHSEDPEISGAVFRRFLFVQELLPVLFVLALCALVFGAYAYSRRIRILRAAHQDLMGEGDDPRSGAGSVRHGSGALRWAVHLLLVLVVPQICVGVALDTINRSKVERKLQAIRDAGDPVAYGVATSTVPDDQNAAILYQQVLRVDFTRGHGLDSNSLLAATGHGQLILREFGKDGSRAAEARAVLDDPAVIGMFETLEQASALPHCVFPIWWARGRRATHHLSALQYAACWLSAKARLCALDGDPDEALRWIAVILRMADHASQGANSNAGDTAIVLQRSGLKQLERTLSEATPSAQAAQDLLDCLGRLDVMAWADRALRGQRAIDIDRYAQLRRPRPGHDWLADARLYSSGYLIYSYRFMVFRPFYNADLNRYLERMEEVIGRSARVPALPAPPRPRRRQHPFGFDLEFVQAVDSFYWSDNAPLVRDTAIMRNDLARVALRLTLHKIEHGEYPATLEWELLRDFFADAPLRYERRPNGFTLYSVGPNGEDDGGVARHGPDWSRQDYDLVWECKAP